MCSVVGCDSWRHNVQRFRLPEDPERRLEWVLFLFEVNKQRLKESSWTDITICSEHFTDDCFVSLALSGSVQLKPGAVPSLWVNTEPEEPVESPQDEVSLLCQLRDHLLLPYQHFTGSLKNCSQASLHVALETETCLQNKSDFQMNVISINQLSYNIQLF
uniref:THAP domain-containing protein 1 n=1 Tax=Oreochromis niloticus TaxID=8128 RepID=A0A669DE67_ORENI